MLTITRRLPSAILLICNGIFFGYVHYHNFAHASPLYMRYRIVIVCIMLLSNIRIFAQEQELKSLTKGNRFVYSYYAYQISGFPVNQYFDFQEDVVGDTMILGKKYAKVISTFNNSLRLERSDKNALYLWDSTEEHVVYRSNYEVGDTVRWHSFLFTPDLFRIVTKRSRDTSRSVGSYSSINTDDALNPRFPFPGIPQFSFGINSDALGLIFIHYASSPYIRPSATWSNNVSLKGGLINGKVFGDTTLKRPFVGLNDTTLVSNQTIEIPLLVRDMNLRYGASFTVSFDSTLIKYINTSGVTNSRINNFGQVELYLASYSQSQPKDSVVWMKFQALNIGDTVSTVAITIPYHKSAELGGRFQTRPGNIKLLSKITVSTVFDWSNCVVYPNPATDKVSFVLSSEVPNVLVLRILNISGIELLQSSEKVIGLARKELDISQLPHGIYFLEVFLGNKRYLGRFIKM